MKDFFKDLARYIPSYIIPALVNLISIPIVTRLFAPVDYGNYVLVLGVVTIMTAFMGWLSISIVRFHPTYEKENKLDIFYSTIIKQMFLSALIISLLFYLSVVLCHNYLTSKVYFLMLVGLVSFVFMSIYSTLLTFFQAKRLANWYSGFIVWRTCAALLLGLLLIVLFKLNVEGLFYGTIISTALALPLVWKKAVSVSPKKPISRPLTKEMAKFSFPLVVGNLAFWVLSLSDRYIIELFRDTSEVGIYSVGYAISERSILVIVSLFEMASSPVAMKIWECEGAGKAAIFNTKLTRFFLIFSLPAAVGLSVLAKPLLQLLTSKEYSIVYRILPIIVTGIFLKGATIGFGHSLGYQKKTKYMMFSLFVGGLINIILNFIFVPKYGYFAAAVTTLIGYIAIAVIDTYFSRKYFSWKFPFNSLLKTGFASIVMGIIVYFLNSFLQFPNIIKLLISIIAGIVTYFIMLIVVREITKEEVLTMDFIKKLKAN
jgi:O-antigen/teichoic acid export membrane protein